MPVLDLGTTLTPFLDAENQRLEKLDDDSWLYCARHNQAFYPVVRLWWDNSTIEGREFLSFDVVMNTMRSSEGLEKLKESLARNPPAGNYAVFAHEGLAAFAFQRMVITIEESLVRAIESGEEAAQKELYGIFRHGVDLIGNEIRTRMPPLTTH